MPAPGEKRQIFALSLKYEGASRSARRGFISHYHPRRLICNQNQLILRQYMLALSANCIF
jgi:hypothetical protein